MSLLAKLRELREARDAGFISEAEEAHAKGPVAVAVTCRLFLRCVPTQMGSPCYSGYAFSLRPALRGTTAGKIDFWAGSARRESIFGQFWRVDIWVDIWAGLRRHSPSPFGLKQSFFGLR